MIPLDEEDKVREISVCGHLFHSYCLETWLKVKESCPFCKHDLSVNEKNESLLKDLLNESGMEFKYLTFFLERETQNPQDVECSHVNESGGNCDHYHQIVDE